MALFVYLFDTRGLPPAKKSDVHEYIEKIAFITNDAVVDNNFAGFVAYFECDPSLYLTKIPHSCPYKDVTGWDLRNTDYIFYVAFKDQS